MSEEYRFKDRIKDIINDDVDYDKLRKAEKQGSSSSLAFSLSC